MKHVLKQGAELFALSLAVAVMVFGFWLGAAGSIDPIRKSNVTAYRMGAAR